MIDVERIKEQVNCRDFIEADLGQPRYRGSVYSAWKCPLHREQKGYSLVAYADHWRCFGKCQLGGDVIAWAREYHRLDFREACQLVTGANLPETAARLPRPVKRRVESMAMPPESSWQEAALQVVEVAETTLWSAAGRRALAYLQEQRGLTEATIREARLGYIPGPPDGWKQVVPGWTRTVNGEMKPVLVPCGITIPHFADGHLWAVRVRRSVGKIKYQAIGGGTKALYGVDEVQPGSMVVITEGEFDCLVLRQCAGDLVDAVSIASASNHRINRRWYPALLGAVSLLVRFDADRGGQQAAQELKNLTRAVRLVQVPSGKDVNDYLLIAGSAGVRTWIQSELKGAMQNG